MPWIQKGIFICLSHFILKLCFHFIQQTERTKFDKSWKFTRKWSDILISWKLKRNWRSMFRMKHLGPTALAEHWYVIFFEIICKNLNYINDNITESYPTDFLDPKVHRALYLELLQIRYGARNMLLILVQTYTSAIWTCHIVPEYFTSWYQHEIFRICWQYI